MKRKYSLYSIVVLVVGLLILISVALNYFLASKYRKDLVESAIREKIHLARVIDETISSPIWTTRLASYPGISKSFIRKMSRFEDVVFCRVVDMDGNIILSSIEEEYGKKVKEKTLIENALKTNKPQVEDEVFGGRKIKVVAYPSSGTQTIFIGFSTERVERIAETMFWQDFLMSFGVSTFVGLILLLFLRSILLPLDKITEACQRVREGNLETKVPIESKTEIGELASAFNKMIEDLKKSQAALEEAKTVLEIKVRARTRELEELVKRREEIIKERTKELNEKVKQLEKFNEFAVGRELRMIELKQEIDRLKREKGIKDNKDRKNDSDKSDKKEKKMNCWDFWNCKKEIRDNCPAYLTDSGRSCWIVSAGRCPRLLERGFEDCTKCPWYKRLNKDEKKEEATPHSRATYTL